MRCMRDQIFTVRYKPTSAKLLMANILLVARHYQVEQEPSLVVGVDLES